MSHYQPKRCSQLVQDEWILKRFWKIYLSCIYSASRIAIQQSVKHIQKVVTSSRKYVL